VTGNDPLLSVDTDALVMLLALDCLGDALECLGCAQDRCYRLPAAPAQARRSRWVGEHWPNADRARMAAAIESLASLPPSGKIEIQDHLNAIEGIDEGEAYLLAAVCEIPGMLLLTGDLRMVRALLTAEDSAAEQVRQAVAGRLILVPQVVEALARKLSLVEVEARWRASGSRHRSLQVIFGSPPTRDDDFHRGCEMQIDSVTGICGADWLRKL
jgi:hypothetical protein